MSNDFQSTLAHYGVKGMKWGVRKRLNPGSGEGNSGGHDSSLTTRQRKKDDKWRYKVNLDAPGLQKSAKFVDKKAIQSINAKPEYKNLDHAKPSKLKERYDNEIHDEWAKAMTRYVSTKHGVTNPSKTKRMEWTWNPKTKSYSSRMVAVEHADEEIITVIESDDKGFITGFLFADSSMIHLDLGSGDESDILVHYGVKGMKWGVRRTRDQLAEASATQKKPGGKIVTKGGGGKPASEDALRAAKIKQQAKASRTDSLSNAELQEAIKRMQLEQQYSQLSKNTENAGLKFVKRLLGDTAQQQSQAVFQTQAAYQVDQALSKRGKPIPAKSKYKFKEVE